MAFQNDLIINISALYRFSQKFFDKNLAKYNLGSGQLIFLILIYENEGINMNQLSSLAQMDKGTTTKSIKKLCDEGYVEIVSDDSDKRLKRMQSTDKTRAIINDIYSLRNEFVTQMMKGMDESQISDEINTFKTLTYNARSVLPDDGYSQIKIGGIQKLTLLDYPGEVACTLFTSGCNLRCPFCHNKDLVFIPENFAYVDPEDILEFLSKRQGILEAVCITGGEPLIQPGIIDFAGRIKSLGYKVKIDTNGFFPDRLKEIVQSGSVDYVAMDIKNSITKYAVTTGIVDSEELRSRLMESIEYLLSDPVDYEFRTTVVKQLHSCEDLIDAAMMIKGAKRYYLQQFVDSGNCIEEGFSGYSKQEMEDLLQHVIEIIPGAQLRGV